MRTRPSRSAKDPQFAEKKARVERLYAIADREVAPQAGDPQIAFCLDEFGPLNLQPSPDGSGPYDERLRRIVDKANVA